MTNESWQSDVERAVRLTFKVGVAALLIGFVIVLALILSAPQVSVVKCGGVYSVQCPSEDLP